MNAEPRSYLNKRLLKLQIGFLLSEGPGSAREFPIHLPQRLHIYQDLFLESLMGSLTLTRTKEGILVQGTLQARHQRQCDRCLDDFEHHFPLSIVELFAFPADPATSEFSVDASGDIDLSPLLREEILIEASYRVVCHDNCRGLCSQSGANLNHESLPVSFASQDLGSPAAYDPRLAVLKQLLDSEGHKLSTTK